MKNTYSAFVQLIAIALTMCFFVPANAMWRQTGKNFSEAFKTATQRLMARQQIKSASQLLKSQSPMSTTTAQTFASSVTHKPVSAVNTKPLARNLTTTVYRNPSLLFMKKPTVVKTIARSYSDPKIKSLHEYEIQSLHKVLDGYGPGSRYDIKDFYDSYNSPEYTHIIDTFIKKNIDRLRAHDITYLYEYHPKFNDAIVDHLLQKISSDEYTSLFDDVLRTYPKNIVKKISEHVLQQPIKTGSSKYLQEIIRLTKDPEILKKVTDFLKQNINFADNCLVRTIIEENPAAIPELTNAALQTLSSTKTVMYHFFYSLHLLMDKNKNNNQLLQKLKNSLKSFLTPSLHERHPILFAIGLSTYRDFFGNDLDYLLKEATLSEKHIAMAITSGTPLVKHINNLPLLEKILKEEQKKALQDVEVFYHGQKSTFLLPDVVFTNLNTRTIKTPLEDTFIFLHARTRPNPEEEKRLKKALLEDQKLMLEKDLLPFVLFVNKALFGNATNIYSSSLYYLENNTNLLISETDIKHSIKDVFSKMNMKNLYEKYAERLDSLQKEYSQLYNEAGSGNLFMISVPKSILSSQVYHSIDAGGKRNFCINGKEIKGIQSVIKILRNPELHPQQPKEFFDKNQFCLIMTHDMMDPQSGVTMKTFNAIDPEKNRLFWEEKYKPLMQEIIEDLEVKKNITTLQPAPAPTSWQAM